MNERINKLAEQAAHDTRTIHNNAYWRMQDEIAEDATWREKFAELIVRECHKVVFQYTGPKSALNILEHFGVEE